MKARAVSIWVSGLLAGGLIGGFLGVLTRPDPVTHDGVIFGFIGGCLLFTCIRLSDNRRSIKPH